MTRYYTTYQEPEKSVLPKVLLTAGLAFGFGVAFTVGYVAWDSQQNRMTEMSAVIDELMAQKQQATATSPLTERQPTAQAAQPQAAVVQAPAAQTPTAQAPVVQVAAAALAAPSPEAVTRTASVDLLDVSLQVQEEPPAPAPLIQQASLSGNSMVDQIRLLVDQSLNPTLPKPQVEDSAADSTISTIVEGVDTLSKAAVNGQYVFTTRGSRNKKLRVLFDSHATLQKSLEKLLSTSARNGKISINPALRDSDGRYDGAVILVDLVQRNLLNGDSGEVSAGVHLREQSSVLLNPVRRPAYISVAEKKKDRFYVVERGDSLAYLALQFYGNGSDFQRIFAANRDILRSPENIRIGQRLRIPAI